MKRKEGFPPEATTQPDMRRPKELSRQSGPAPKHRQPQPSTLPPPKSTKGKAGPSSRKPPADTRTSGIQSKRPRKPGGSDNSAANVDEVVADLTNDPRRERDDD